LQRVFACFAVLVSIQLWVGAKPKGEHNLPDTLGMGGAGTVIGTISAIVGIGGGSLTVPFLSWCGVNMRNAVATSAACGLPIAMAGAIGFVVAGWRELSLPVGSSGYLYWPALVGIAVASFLTAPVGARLAHSLPVAVLKRAFALLLLIVGIKLLFGGS
ncbi:MAG: sulfite exporter TauE/SafE family protein, partial [Chromatiales bacterium]|nr:sulfite exporter TauE/SafE family protein [Chromatiales bacterium]